MSDIAIRVENLGKRYEIGELVTVRDLPRVARKVATAPFRKLFGRSSAISGNGTPDGQAHDGLPSADAVDEDSPRHFWALRDINFEVKHGEVLGIIGRNGAGKSTLLKVLSRITSPTTGSADVFGRVASLLEVGTGFHPDLTGRENVYLNGSILGMTRREIAAQFDEIVAFAGVEKFIDTPVKRYSSGMRVRLGFAVAAHLDPEILIVDEVLAVGDAGFQSKCLGKMGEVAQGGRTVLFVSHNLAMVETLCPKGLLLDNGSIRAAGDITTALNAYSSLFGHTRATGLADRTDRTGDGPIRIIKIDYQDEYDAPIAAARLGHPLRIRMHYRSSHVPVANVWFTLNFFDNHNRLVFKCNNELASSLFQVSASAGQFVCDIPKLPLTPGVYHLNFHCKVNGMKSDNVERAAELMVESGDYFGTGRTFNDQRGGICVDHRWACQESVA